MPLLVARIETKNCPPLQVFNKNESAVRNKLAQKYADCNHHRQTGMSLFRHGKNQVTFTLQLHQIKTQYEHIL